GRRPPAPSPPAPSAPSRAPRTRRCPASWPGPARAGPGRARSGRGTPAPPGPGTRASASGSWACTARTPAAGCGRRRAAPSSRTAPPSLGNGNDQAFETLSGALTGPPRVYFQNVGGTGYDGVRFTGVGDIAPTASLQVDSLGGADPNTFHVDYSGQLNGK